MKVVFFPLWLSADQQRLEVGQAVAVRAVWGSPIRHPRSIQAVAGLGEICFALATRRSVVLVRFPSVGRPSFRFLQEALGEVSCLAVHPLLPLVAIACGGACCFVDTLSMQIQRHSWLDAVGPRAAGVSAMAWSPSGDILACGLGDAVLELRCTDFHLVVAGQTRAVGGQAMQSGTALQVEGGSSLIQCLCWSSDSKQVAVACGACVTLLSITLDHEIVLCAVAAVLRHEAAVHEMQLGGDGSVLMAVTEANIVFWDVAAQQVVPPSTCSRVDWCSPGCPWRCSIGWQCAGAHGSRQGRVGPLACTSPAGDVLAIASASGHVDLLPFPCRPGSTAWRHASHVSEVVGLGWTGGDGKLVSGCKGGMLVLWRSKSQLAGKPARPPYEEAVADTSAVANVLPLPGNLEAGVLDTKTMGVSTATVATQTGDSPGGEADSTFLQRQLEVQEAEIKQLRQRLAVVQSTAEHEVGSN
mmetsp:Transcript_86453/g.231631  ORF Transcript_86453/g.231631 Transcript_86453/m.231631 type:complete len:470 (+) Transcript_86453:1651-3060(+)